MESFIFNMEDREEDVTWCRRVILYEFVIMPLSDTGLTSYRHSLPRVGDMYIDLAKVHSAYRLFRYYRR